MLYLGLFLSLFFRSEAQAQIPSSQLPEYLWSSAEAWDTRRSEILQSPLAEILDHASSQVQQTGAVSEVDSFEERMNAQRRLEALVVLAALNRDAEAGAEAGAICLPYLDHVTSDLGKASLSLNLVVAYAFTRQYWTEAQRKQVAAALFDMGKSFQTIGRGNPDNPFNNWWGVTHSGAGLCFLAVLEEYPEAAPLLEKEMQHIAAYLQNYGTQGHYYEGTGYGLYALANWGPFLLAAEHALGKDLAHLNPGVRQFGKLVYTLTTTDTIPDQVSDSTLLGRRIAWNDDGSGFPEASIASLFFPMAQAEDGPRFKTAYDRLCGPDGDDSYTQMSLSHGHAMWTLLYYPLEDTELEYENAFERFYYDNKLGLAVFRNRFQDKNDTLLGVYAKAYHGGGHTQQDAGSFRLLGLGSSWAHFGGQAKPAAIYQNVILKNGTQLIRQDRYQTQTGKVVYLTHHEQGGSISVDLRDIYESPRVRRHFSVYYDPLPEVTAIVGIWDEVIDQEDSEWGWSWCFENKLELKLGSDQTEFNLMDNRTGNSVQVALGGVSNIHLQDFTGPPSNRTFSNGQKREYPGVRYITATTTTDRLNLLTVLTLQEGEAPSIEFSGTDYDLKATVADSIEISLERSKWFQGPLEISATQGE